jgi:hypothetical protein
MAIRWRDQATKGTFNGCESVFLKSILLTRKVVFGLVLYYLMLTRRSFDRFLGVTENAHSPLLFLS